VDLARGDDALWSVRLQPEMFQRLTEDAARHHEDIDRILPGRADSARPDCRSPPPGSLGSANAPAFQPLHDTPHMAKASRSMRPPANSACARGRSVAGSQRAYSPPSRPSPMPVADPPRRRSATPVRARGAQRLRQARRGRARPRRRATNRAQPSPRGNTQRHPRHRRKAPRPPHPRPRRSHHMTHDAQPRRASQATRPLPGTTDSEQQVREINPELLSQHNRSAS